MKVASEKPVDNHNNRQPHPPATISISTPAPHPAKPDSRPLLGGSLPVSPSRSTSPDLHGQPSVGRAAWGKVRETLPHFDNSGHPSPQLSPESAWGLDQMSPYHSAVLGSVEPHTGQPEAQLYSQHPRNAHSQGVQPRSGGLHSTATTNSNLIHNPKSKRNLSTRVSNDPMRPHATP